MKNVKKIMALALALIVMIAPVNVKAAASTNDLAKEFTAKFFETNYPDNVADMIELFLDAEDKHSIKQVYDKVYEILAAGAYAGKLEEYSKIIDAISDFAVYADDTKNNINTDNLIEYIREGKKTDFDDHLAKHMTEINEILDDNDIEYETIDKGFAKIDEAVEVIDTIVILCKNDKIFSYNTKTKKVSLNESLAREILGLPVAHIADIDSAIAQLNEFATYANEKVISSDKDLIVEYLEGVGILEKHTPSTGGGDSPSGGGNPPATGEDDGNGLGDLIEDIKDPAKQEEAINKTEEALEDLSNVVAGVKTEAEAFSALKSVTATLADATTIVKAIDNAAGQKAVVDKVTGLLESTVQALDMIDNAGAVKLKVEAMIKDVAKLKEAAGKSLGNATKIDQALVRLAEKAIEKAATVKATSSDLSKVDFAAQAVKANKVKVEMLKALTASKIKGNKALETKVTVEVPTAKNAKEVEVTLPDLTEVFKSVDKVKVESSIASFELTAGTFGKLEAKDLKLSATTIDKTALTASQIAKLPAGVTNIIDLNANVNGAQVSKFKKAIEVSVPYTLNKGENPDKISVYLLTDAGEIKKVAGKYNPITGQISIMRKHFSKYFIAEANDTFSDIASYSWAKEQIETLAGKGIIGGIGNDKFDPSANISRSAFVALVARMLQLDGDVTTLKFEDVSVDAWYAKEVAAAVEAGLIDGRSATEFAPNDTITRQEAAVVISNAMKISGYTIEENSYIITNNVVDSLEIAKWAKNAVATVYRDGIITGKPGNKFDPAGKATRAEAAVMMYRLYFGN